ncbi:response regulator transcription factor [Mycobacteroides abscessus]|uniref:response regulator transcription factor n=1 Tax=Mycobacteroides abscessus TaxID=36809 RepID=UPI0009A6C124|nr:response regulator transcription factor [Mycobacteroides abscessus]SLI95743.1 two component transcriptional regulator [Mycobacteroides abscessus subsp. bolletii]
MARVLLIEDDVAIVAALSLSLERLGHVVTNFPSAPKDLDSVVVEHDVVVLDLGLPGEDGFAVCRRIRRGVSGGIPIVILTARSDDIDTVAGLEAGADDYVVKPVSPRVLDARIKAALRRTFAPRRDEDYAPASVTEQALGGVQIVGDLMLDRGAAEVRRGGDVLPLSPTEKRLVYVFADHAGRVLSRAQLLSLVWDHEFLGDSRLVDNAVQRLRAKLSESGSRVCIDTVRGFGYRLQASSALR